jgi:hypothetical protein
MTNGEIILPESPGENPLVLAQALNTAMQSVSAGEADNLAIMGLHFLGGIEDIGGAKELTVQTTEVYATDRPIDKEVVHATIIGGEEHSIVSFVFGGFQYIRGELVRGYFLAMDKSYIWKTDELKDHVYEYPRLPLYASVSSIVAIQPA